MSDDALIEALFRVFLGRPSEPAAKAFWHEKVANGLDLYGLIRGIAFSAEARAFAERQQQGGNTRVIENVAAGELLVRRVTLPGDVVVRLALPLVSADPIVAAYMSGKQPNDYMIALMLELTAAGEQVVDLGAHVGTFSVPAAALGRLVLAVDAAATHVALIESSKALNGLEGLTVVRSAVTRKDGAVSFNEAGLFGAIDYAGDNPSAHLVPGKRLGALLREHGIKRVGLIKMDIEGAELHALESIAKLLEGKNGPAILYESNAETFATAGYSVPEMRAWLEARDYRSYRIEGERWVYAGVEQPQPELWVDLIALNAQHRERFAARIDEVWTVAGMRDRALEWAALPYPNTKAHVLQMLLHEPSLRLRYPELKKLTNELLAVQAEMGG